MNVCGPLKSDSKNMTIHIHTHIYADNALQTNRTESSQLVSIYFHIPAMFKPRIFLSSVFR